MFIFEYVPEDGDYNDAVRVEVGTGLDATWPQVLNQFLGFLRLHGYIFSNKVQQDLIEVAESTLAAREE